MTQSQKIIKYFALALAIWIIINIIGGIFWFVSFFIPTTEDGQRASSQFLEVENQSVIDSLDIDLSYTKLTIKRGEGSITVEANDKYVESHRENNKLIIQEKNHKLFSRRVTTECVIYIPESYQFDEVNIETGAGEVKIDDLSTKVFDFDIGAGKVEIGTLTSENKTSIDGGAGEFTISDSRLNNLDLDMGVGKTTINAILTGTTDIDAGVGELSINLLDEITNYRISVDKGLGKIKVNNEEVNDNYTYNEGTNLIKIDGGVGSINITSKQADSL